MKWAFEIIRAFFVAFGTMQTIANLNYLIKKDGVELAKRQHKELPDTVADKQLRVKTICMLLFGMLFLVTGLFSYFTHSYYKLSFIIVLGAYSLYALIEAIYYSFWRTFGAFGISAILLIVASLA